VDVENKLQKKLGSLEAKSEKGGANNLNDKALSFHRFSGVHDFCDSS
jgi:hypothetical protein